MTKIEKDKKVRKLEKELSKVERKITPLRWKQQAILAELDKLI